MGDFYGLWILQGVNPDAGQGWEQPGGTEKVIDRKRCRKNLLRRFHRDQSAPART